MHKFTKDFANNSMRIAAAICWPMVLFILLVYSIIKLWTDGVKGIIGDGE